LYKEGNHELHELHEGETGIGKIEKMKEREERKEGKEERVVKRGDLSACWKKRSPQISQNAQMGKKRSAATRKMDVHL
jgi:hypothetical protein